MLTARTTVQLSSTSSEPSNACTGEAASSPFFTFLLPLVFFLLLGSVYGDDEIDGVTARRTCSPGCSATASSPTAFAGLAIITVIRREEGVLKRLRGTPLPAWAYLAAVIASTLLVFASRRSRSSSSGGRCSTFPFRTAGSRSCSRSCSAAWPSPRSGSG